MSEPTEPVDEPRIRILPDSLVDKIAAGEVVERPASVVKELVENSIDAGASYVEVEVRGGGKELIVVRDDGHGMTPEELRLAVRRHATSKISSMEDLDSIQTYGFRGEALPSIASVSLFRISSRTGDMDLAYWMEIENSSMISDGYEPSSPGTRVWVRDLFRNVPARLKFLKKDATELAHIQDTVVRLAMVNPSVRFRLITDGRTALDLVSHPSRQERVRALLRRRGRTEFFTHTKEAGDYRAMVVAAPPHVTVSDTSGVYLFVNDRVVKDRFLLGALLSGYAGMLERRRYPIAVLYLWVPPGSLDVNVHPQKLEVRFRDERTVASLVRSTVGELMARAPWAPGGERAPEPQPQTRKFGALSYGDRPSQRPAPARTYTLRKGTDHSPEPLAQGDRLAPSPAVSPQRTVARPSLPKAGRVQPTSAPPESSLPSIGRLGARYVGQLHALYLVFETPDGMLVLDQHAAHERIRYVTILRQMQERQVVQQRLLFPERVELTPQEREFLEENGVPWERLGFDVESFGAGEIAIRAIPDVLRGADIEALVHDVLGSLMRGGSGLDSDTLDHLAATMACHGAIRGGDAMGAREAEELLRQIQEVESGGHCPHGRPVYFTMSLAELKRRFHRT